MVTIDMNIPLHVWYCDNKMFFVAVQAKFALLHNDLMIFNQCIS